MGYTLWAQGRIRGLGSRAPGRDEGTEDTRGSGREGKGVSLGKQPEANLGNCLLPSALPISAVNVSLESFQNFRVTLYCEPALHQDVDRQNGRFRCGLARVAFGVAGAQGLAPHRQGGSGEWEGWRSFLLS